MAFEVPNHLPQRQLASSGSEEVGLGVLHLLTASPLSKLSLESVDGWVAELDAAITDTKGQISALVRNLGEEFTRQLTIALSLPSLVDEFEQRALELGSTVHHPKTGFLPRVTAVLDAHDSLAIEALNRQLAHAAFTYLEEQLRALSEVRRLEESGDIPSAAAHCQTLSRALVHPPEPLGASSRFLSLKKEARTIHDKIHEQLLLLVNQCVIINASEVVISRTVSSNKYPDANIHLDSIFGAMETAALQQYLDQLRKKLLDLFLQPVILLELGVENHSTEGDVSKMTLVPVSTSGPDTYSHLSRCLRFLSTDLFVHLPAKQRTEFPTTIYEPVVGSILEHHFASKIPTTIQNVGPFLSRLSEAVAFETELNEIGLRRVNVVLKDWASSADAEYERSRAHQLLQRVRDLMHEPLREPLFVEVDDPSFVAASDEAISGRSADTNWGFSEDTVDGDGWGFQEDDDVGESTSEPGGDEGWGWDDDTEEPSLQDANLKKPSVSAEDNSSISLKTGTRLEKLSGFKTPKLSPSNASSIPVSHIVSSTETRKQRYRVSSRAGSLIKLARTILQEAQSIATSTSFHSPLIEFDKPRGRTVFQVAAGSFDLLRSEFVLVKGSEGPESIQWVSDFAFLAREARALGRSFFFSDSIATTATWESIAEGLEKFKEFSLEECAHNESMQVQRLLPTDLFKGMSDDGRFHEATRTLSLVTERIRVTSRLWETILLRDDYFLAVGSLVNALLTRAVISVLSLSDITEVESRRLAELCRLLEQVQALFIKNGELDSLVGEFVPSWFRFQYLAELLVASIADISYLFDEGMLVDYEAHEIIGLLRALFADTPLRENTIRRIEQTSMKQSRSPQ